MPSSIALKRLRVPIFRRIVSIKKSGREDENPNGNLSKSERAKQAALEQIKKIVFGEKFESSEMQTSNAMLDTTNSFQQSNQIGISLSGCGFLGTYHFGVMICFQKNAKSLMAKVTHFGGSSAGSLMAALLALAPDSLENGLMQLYELADELNRLTLGAMTPGFQLARKLAGIVEIFLPDDVSSADDRLFVSLTRQSIYSMGYFGIPPEIDNELYIDGGYSNNLPIFDKIPTITISPFSGSAIISPADLNSIFDWKMRLGNQYMKVNLNNVVRGAQALFPPNRSVLVKYYEMGFRNAMQFLQQHGLYERAEGDPV